MIFPRWSERIVGNVRRRIFDDPTPTHNKVARTQRRQSRDIRYNRRVPPKSRPVKRRAQERPSTQKSEKTRAAGEERKVEVRHFDTALGNTTQPKAAVQAHLRL